MSVIEISGNLFNSEAEAIVNTVNCVGVMGKGIALEFRRRFPKMFETYQQECGLGEYKPGQIKFYYERGRIIINCAIKDHWRYPSKLEWLESCLDQFSTEYQSRNIQSTAFPWMGAQNGQLPFHQIQEKMRQYLHDLPNIDIEVYDFDPKATDPLYKKLEMISKKDNPVEYQPISGLRKYIFLKIIDSVQTGKVTSLFMLSSQGIIGEKSADKLYHFLIEIDMDNLPPNQLTFL